MLRLSGSYCYHFIAQNDLNKRRYLLFRKRKGLNWNAFISQDEILESCVCGVGVGCDVFSMGLFFIDSERRSFTRPSKKKKNTRRLIRKLIIERKELSETSLTQI